MNTGVQRSSTSPFGAATTTTPVGVARGGKETTAKDLALIMALHRIPYAATATLSHMEDFAKKLRKAEEKKKEGFVYIHVFSPCPVGWRIKEDSAIQVCRMAVRTNYFPLWEAENGRFRFTHKTDKPRPIHEFTGLMGRFSHLKEEDINKFQQLVNERYDLIKSLCEMGN